jgi:Uma2 family endonuclease
MATVTPIQPTSALPLPSPANVYRITVDQYDRMIESGALGKDDWIELLGGVLVRKMPKNARHTTSSDLCRQALAGAIPPGWYVRQEQAIRIPDFDEPEPDLAVVRGNIRTYARRHPGPRDIALLVEVAAGVTSLTAARGQKLRIYARSGIAVYWIVNLTRKNAVVEVYAHPTRTRGYRDRVDFKAREQVPVVIDRREVGRIAIADLLP